MKLQKQISRVIDDKEYPKWIIVIPPATIEKIGWNEGDWLKEKIQGENLIIRPMKSEEIKELMMKKETKPSYDEFKERIELLLNKNTDGLTWTEIRKAGRFLQKVPNNKWVKKLEVEIGLKRTRVRDKGIVWKLH